METSEKLAQQQVILMAFFTSIGNQTLWTIHSLRVVFGSESYWSSHAITSFAVDPVAPTPTSAPIQQDSMVEQYFVPAIAGVIVVVIIGFVTLALLMLRKRP